MAAAHLRGVTPSFATFCSKAAFNSRPEALRAKGKMRRHDVPMVAHGTGTLRVYKCKACEMFHLGSK